MCNQKLISDIQTATNGYAQEAIRILYEYKNEHKTQPLTYTQVLDQKRAVRNKCLRYVLNYKIDKNTTIESVIDNILNELFNKFCTDSNIPFNK